MISETKFKQVATLIKKELFTQFPHLKNPVPREKSGVSYKLNRFDYANYKQMHLYLSGTIILSLNEWNVFSFTIRSFINEDQKNAIQTILLNCLEEKKVEGFLSPLTRSELSDRINLIPISEPYKKLFSGIQHFKEIEFHKEKGFILKTHGLPEFICTIVSKKKPSILVTSLNYSKEFHTKETFSSFIHGLFRDKTAMEEKKEELKQFLLGYKGVHTDKYGVSLKLSGEYISYGLAKVAENRESGLTYYGWFQSFSFRGTLFEVTTYLKKHMHAYIIQNRLRKVFDPKKKAQ